MTDGHEVRTSGPGTGEVGRAGRHASPSTSSVTETPLVRHAPRRGRGLAVVITVLIVLLGGAAVVGAFLLSAPSATPAPVEFEVMPGWAGQRVADELADVGLVRSATAFEYYLRFRDLDHSIGEGLYDLDPTMSARQVAEALVAGGRPRVARVVLPEGVRASDVVARLVDTGIASRDSLEELIEDPGLDLAPPYAPAEEPASLRNTRETESARGFLLGLLAVLLILAVLAVYIYAAWLSDSNRSTIEGWLPWM